MIKDAIANIAKQPPPETLQAVSLATEFPVDHSPHPEIDESLVQIEFGLVYG